MLNLGRCHLVHRDISNYYARMFLHTCAILNDIMYNSIFKLNVVDPIYLLVSVCRRCVIWVIPFGCSSRPQIPFVVHNSLKSLNLPRSCLTQQIPRLMISNYSENQLVWMTTKLLIG